MLSSRKGIVLVKYLEMSLNEFNLHCTQLGFDVLKQLKYDVFKSAFDNNFLK